MRALVAHGAIPAVMACVLALPLPSVAQTAGTRCGDLVSQYDEAIRTADGLVSTAVEHLLKGSNPSGALQRLGIDMQGASPEQAIRRGALAALPPPTQAAILIHLVRANTAMQALTWKGCAPPSTGN